ncbi:hypothetical protein V1527DRAFT_485829 [Lipomyces starkeyi]
MQLSLFLNNPVVSAGSRLTGTVSLTLDKPTSIEDIYSKTETTYRVTERHLHADIITSLFDQPRGTFLPPGEHILLFTIQVPVYSECTCLAHCDQYSQFRLSRWTCQHSGVDVGLVRTGLPPKCHASRSMYVGYRLVAAVDRPGIFKWQKSVSRKVTLVPATLVHSSALLYDRDSRNLVEVYKTIVLSAKCDKLPEEYFVQGALPQVSGLKKLISFSSKHTYVDVPMEAEIILYNNGEASIGEHLPFELYISVQVDDISRIVGVVNIKLTSIKVTLRSETSCYAQKHPNSSSDKTILFEHNKLDIPLAPEKSEGRAPRFRIDDKVFKAIELGNNIVPDFDIMSFRHRHKICAAIGLSFNDGGTRAVEVSHAIIINSGIDYDLDTNMLLPSRYQIADYNYEYDNDSIKTNEEADFFDYQPCL